MATMWFAGPSFGLEVPTDWFAFASPEHQTVFLSPPTAEGERANLTITLRPASPGLTAEQFTDALAQAAAQIGLQPEVLSRETIALGEQRGLEVVQRFLTPQGGGPALQRQVVAVHGGFAYVLSATRPTTMAEALGAHVDAIFARMFGTFTFRDAVLEA